MKAKLNIKTGKLVSLSKSKKAKSPRQKFLSALMKHVSGDTGEKLAGLFAAGKSDELEAEMAKIGKVLGEDAVGQKD